MRIPMRQFQRNTTFLSGMVFGVFLVTFLIFRHTRREIERQRAVIADLRDLVAKKDSHFSALMRANVRGNNAN